MQIYRESIQEFRLKKHTVRVWREAKEGDSIASLHDEDVSLLLHGLCEDGVKDIESLARAVLDLERVNAIEVKDSAGNGCVLYRSELVSTRGGDVIAVI